MNRKKTVSLLLALVLTVALAASGFSASAEAAVATDVDQQVSLITSQLGSLKQADGVSTWYYAVTDLDHDGNLEFVAASQHPYDRSTNLKVWEVGADRASLSECVLSKDAEESFPDILTDNADTFHDTATDTWSYLLYDNVVISNSEVYTVKTSVSMKDGVISYDSYGVEHTVVQNNVRNVSHTDQNGLPISAEMYNASGVNAFPGAERSSTSFDWLTAADLENVSRLKDSYLVFSGQKAPTETLPIPRPAALQTSAAATPAPTATPVPTQTQQNVYLSVTKNPTNENKKVGGTAYFVSCANIYESLYWTFVAPDGGEYTPASFVSGSGAYCSGEYSTTLTVSNLESWMNGWGAYCTFYYKGQTARTSTAYIYVNGANPQTPDWNVTYSSMSGTSYSNNIASVYIILQNGQGITVDGSKVTMVSGYSIDGAPCTVYYTGSYPTESSIYRVDIYGISQSEWEANNYSDQGYYDPDLNLYITDDTIYSDNGYVTVYDDGSIETYDYNTGTNSYYANDGSYYNAYADGSSESYDATTGNSYFYGDDGSIYTAYADGSVEYWDASTGESGYFGPDYGFIDYG